MHIRTRKNRIVRLFMEFKQSPTIVSIWATAKTREGACTNLYIGVLVEEPNQSLDDTEEEVHAAE